MSPTCDFYNPYLHQWNEELKKESALETNSSVAHSRLTALSLTESEDDRGTHESSTPQRRRHSREDHDDLKQSTPERDTLSRAQIPALVLSDSDDDLSTIESPIPRRKRHSWNEDRQVRFQCAQVREYSVTIGDHPMCCDPLPLTLDWQHGEERSYDIDVYENMRAPRRKGKRGYLERLGFGERREKLNEVSNALDSDDMVNGQEMYGETPQEFCDPLTILDDFKPTNWLGVCYGGGIPAMKVQVLDE